MKLHAFNQYCRIHETAVYIFSIKRLSKFLHILQCYPYLTCYKNFVFALILLKNHFENFNIFIADFNDSTKNAKTLALGQFKILKIISK